MLASTFTQRMLYEQLNSVAEEFCDRNLGFVFTEDAAKAKIEARCWSIGDLTEFSTPTDSSITCENGTTDRSSESTVVEDEHENKMMGKENGFEGCPVITNGPTSVIKLDLAQLEFYLEVITATHFSDVY